MDGWVTALGVVLALDGIRVARSTPAATPTARTIGVVVAALGAAAVAVLAEPVLDAGDISPETFRIGIGLVVAAVGLVRLMVGPGRPYDEVWPRAPFLIPVAFPVAFTPELAAWTASRGVDDLGATLVGIVIAAVLAGLSCRFPLTAGRSRLAEAWVRFVGAGLAVLGVILVIDGIRAV